MGLLTLQRRQLIAANANKFERHPRGVFGLANAQGYAWRNHAKLRQLATHVVDAMHPPLKYSDAIISRCGEAHKEQK
jgi:hypothetical protein